MLPLYLLPLVGITQFPGAAPVAPNVQKGFDAITVSDAKKWLGYLAGPECAGRGTGQPGFQKAADFVAARFKQFGLKPAGENGSYFQHLPFIRYRYDPVRTSLGLSDGAFNVKPEKDFTIKPGSTDIDVTASIAFIRGNGKIDLKDRESIKGRIVVLWLADGYYYSDAFRAVYNDALFTFAVVDKVVQQDWAAVQNAPGVSPHPGSPRMGYITLKAAKKLAEQVLTTKDFWQKPVLADTFMEAGSERQMHIEAKAQSEPVGVPNVIGLLEGSDPVLKQEVVAVGAHLDHIGSDGGTVWWGADDNGSGSTALLGVAKAFSVNKMRPKRSVLFISFCAEEIGLQGSLYFLSKPTWPLDKFVCYLNMDMVGRSMAGGRMGNSNAIHQASENQDTLSLNGAKETSVALETSILDVNRSVGFRFKPGAVEPLEGSDHAFFAKNGIPVASFFCGFTPDYHKPTDTVDKIDFTKIVNSAKLCYLTLMRVGNMEGKLKRNGTDSKSDDPRLERRQPPFSLAEELELCRANR